MAAPDIPIRWRVTSIGGDTRDRNDGSAFDGQAFIGRVTMADDCYSALFGSWKWSMTATGFGRGRIRTSGRELTKDGAKAATETAYRQLAAADPGNRDSVLDRAEHGRRRAEMWRRSRAFHPETA